MKSDQGRGRDAKDNVVSHRGVDAKGLPIIAHTSANLPAQRGETSSETQRRARLEQDTHMSHGLAPSLFLQLGAEREI